MGDIVKTADLMLQSVIEPVLRPAAACHIILRPGTAQHDFRPCRIVIRFFQNDGKVMDYGGEDCFRHPVGHFHILCMAEVAFHGMGHDVHASACRLVRRQRIGKLRIHNGEYRAHQR